MIGEGVAVHANFFVSSFHVRRLERWFADDQSVTDLLIFVSFFMIIN